MACEERIARLRAFMEQHGYDAVVLRNNPDLRWLTGAQRVFDFEVAHTAFVTQDGLWLHTDSRYFNTFVERLGTTSAWTIDMNALDAPAWIAARVGQTHARVVAIEDTNTLAFADGLDRALGDASLSCLLPRLHGDLCTMRAVKDAQELDALRAAQRITDDAFAYMCTVIRPGLTEMQLRAELDNYMLSHGADALAFDSIVASGPNSANPHALPGQRAVEKGDFVLMDFGASLNDYRSDMTRTVVVGDPSPRHLEIYDVVRRAHEAAAAFAKAGVVGAQVHQVAADVIEQAGYGDCFKHGLGHGVGIEIHELPRFGRGYQGVIEAGSVVTVEPGVYVPGFGGVRLEDCGVVTEEGYVPFTQSSHDLVVL